MPAPHGDILIVKDYCRKVGNITDTTYNAEISRAYNKARAALAMDDGEEILDSYTYLGLVKLYIENKAACEIHKMFGDPDDAERYCEDAKEDLELLIAADAKLEPSLTDVSDIGSVGTPLPKTYPSNPDGMRLVGRSGLGQVE